MKCRHALLAALAFSTMSLSAHAEATKPATAPAAQAAAAPHTGPDGLPRWNKPPQSRKEQIERFKARTAALEKMTDAQWAEIRARQAARRGGNRGQAANPPVQPAQPVKK